MTVPAAALLRDGPPPRVVEWHWGIAALLVAMPFVMVVAEPYHIMTDSPVHVAGAGNEVVTIYGEAPGAQWVNVTFAGGTHGIRVHGDSFHATLPAPPPGTYGVTGVWWSERLVGGPGGMGEELTVGHMVDGVLAVLGRGYGDIPDGTVTIVAGAHAPECAGCIIRDGGPVGVGGYVLVSNADAEHHRFTANATWAAESTGDLAPGESVRVPFLAEGTAGYRCAYHPWLEFTVRSAGAYEPPGEPAGGVSLDVPERAGESVKIGITHAGGAAVAHVVFIQGGRVLDAGTAVLAGGYGSYAADARDWRAGEVTVTVSAGGDYAAGTISVEPARGAMERAGRTTGYDGNGGIMMEGVPSRPAGVIPLDVAAEAVEQLCPIGGEAAFRGDAGLAPRGAMHVEGTVWCGGVNLGVYLLESGLAVTDPAECGLAMSEWLLPYCDPSGSPAGEPPEVQPPEASLPEATPEPSRNATIPYDDNVDTTSIIKGPPAERCDHVTDPSCPCPDGWVRNGEWCDPDWRGGLDDAGGAVGGAAGTVGGAAGDALDAASDAASGAREGMVGVLGGFFRWIGDGLASIPGIMTDAGGWMWGRVGMR